MSMKDALGKPRTPAAKRPAAPQTYKGNGHHVWEPVCAETRSSATDNTYRLRVPGGWLYRTSINFLDANEHFAWQMNTVFVPMPDIVKHEI